MPDVDAAIDNDLILKAISYGLQDRFWPPEPDSLGILGAARYVVGAEIERCKLHGEVNAVRANLAALLARCQELEPNEGELELAAELELGGQELGLALDAGESQLTAIVLSRGLALLETGDKRAISALERLRLRLDWLEPLRQRVRCLEQIALLAAAEDGGFSACSAAICSEPGVDKSLSVCFGCFSGSPAPPAVAIEALKQYIAAVREAAPGVLISTP